MGGNGMKKKRYFCDFWFGPSNSFKHFTLIMVLALVVLTIIAGMINRSIIFSKFEYELDAYSESTYQRLNEIADEVICEGQDIDVTAIPSDVMEYEMVRKPGAITFKFSLDNTKEMKFAPSIGMTVELSENFEVVSKSCLSQEEFVRKTKFTMNVIAFAYGALIIIVVCFVAVIGCTIAAGISTANKKRDNNLS